MEYKVLLVHLRLGASNEALLRVTGELSERFGAHVIGVAVSRPVPPIYPAMETTYGTGLASESITEHDRKLTEKRIAEAEERFRAALKDHCCDPEWRCAITTDSRSQYVARQARAADLLITSPDWDGSPVDQSQRLSLDDVVMLAGRPVLLIPPETQHLDLNSVVIFWKDTREARRAISDAMPLLKLARQTTVVEITEAGDISDATRHVDDVMAWLGRHGIAAQPRVERHSGSEQTQLKAIAQECGAGLVIAGAYGHARVREWVLGGVTMDLLLHPKRPVLISH